MERIYTDGSGKGDMAWYNERTNESWSGHKEGITNNEAEYLAIYHALNSAKEREVEILSDSKLAVNQLKREWHVKDDKLRRLFDRIQDLINSEDLKVNFKWVSRMENKAGKYLG